MSREKKFRCPLLWHISDCTRRSSHVLATFCSANWESTSSSSFCRVPVANAPDVLQPCWLIVLPLDVPTLTTSCLQRDPRNQRNYIYKPFLDVPTFTTSRLLEILAAKGGTMWVRNGRWILPEMPDFHVTFRDLLHVVNLQHGTDGFTSPPKEVSWESTSAN
jgi:hypothetical protein